MSDPITSYLQNANLPQQAKADAWEAAQSPDQGTFNQKIGSLSVPASVKADLWQIKYGKQTATPQPSAAPPAAPKDVTIGDWLQKNIGTPMQNTVLPAVQRYGQDALHLSGLDEMPGLEDVRAKYGNTGLDYKSNAPTLMGRIKDSLQQPLIPITDLQTYKHSFDPNTTSTTSQILQHTAKFAEGLSNGQNSLIGAVLGPAGEAIGAAAGVATGSANVAAQVASGLQRGAAGYFGATGAYQGVKSAKAAIEDKLNNRNAVGDTTDALLNLTMGGVGLFHAAKGGVTAPESQGITTTPEATPTEATPTEATPTEATPTEATPTEATPPNAAGTMEILPPERASRQIVPKRKPAVIEGVEWGTGVKGMLPAPADAEPAPIVSGEQGTGVKGMLPAPADAEPAPPAAEVAPAQEAAQESPGQNSPLMNAEASAPEASAPEASPESAQEASPIRGDLSPGDAPEPLPVDPNAKQTRKALALEDDMRPEIGQAMRLSQLLHGDRTAEVLQRGIDTSRGLYSPLDEHNALEQPPLSPDEQQIASAALGEPVRGAFTPEQMQRAQDMLGRQQTEGPVVQRLRRKLTAKTQAQVALDRTKAEAAVADPETDPAVKASLQKMLAPDPKTGEQQPFLYRPRTTTAPPYELGEDDPDAEFTSHAYGQEVPEITQENVSAATGRLGRLGTLERTTDLGLGDPDLKAQIDHIAESGSLPDAKGESTTGMEEAVLPHKADAFVSALKRVYARAALQKKLEQVLVSLRAKLAVYHKVRNPQADTLGPKLRALSDASYLHLPPEIKRLATHPTELPARTPKAASVKKSVSKAEARKKRDSTATTARRSSASATAATIDAIRKSHPEKLPQVQILQQATLEHFKGDTDGAVSALNRALKLYKRQLDEGNDFALKNALKQIRRLTPNDGTGSVTFHSGVDPIKAVQSAKALYRFGNPKLTDEDIRNISNDALDNILGRYEKMSPTLRSVHGKSLWDNSLDRMADDADPELGERLRALRNSIPPSRDLLPRLKNLFTGLDPDLARFKQLSRTIRGSAYTSEVSFRAGLEKFERDAQSWPAGKSIEFIDRMERGADQGDPFLNQLASALRDALDGTRDKFRDTHPEALKTFIEDYFPHSWANVGAAAKFFGSLGSKLGGDTSFLMQRTHALFAEGIQAGLQPITWNPVRLVAGRINQMEKAIVKTKTLEMMDQNGYRKLVPTDVPAPMGYKPLLDKYNRTPNGQYYAPDAIADHYNKKFASKGLANTELFGLPIYNMIRAANNVGTMLQLGLSPVHAFTTARGALATEIGRAVTAATQGRYADAGKHALWSATALGPVIRDFHLGQQLSRALKNPQDHLDYAEFANRIMPTANMHIGQDPELDARFSDMLNRSWKITKDSNFSIAARLKAAPVAAYAAVGELMHKISQPIMGSLVPNVKMAALYHQSMDAIRNSDGDADKLDQQIQSIADNVDDRFGEFTTDNLWWNQTTKDLSGLLFLSRGWTYGNYRMYSGSGIDLVNQLHQALNGQMPKLTNRQAGVIGGLVALAYTNAIYQGLHPNAPPVQGLDYLYPRDGSKDGDGNWNRMNPLAPEYDPISFFHAPVDTVIHKESPLLATIGEEFQNKDYYGHAIVDAEDNRLTGAVKRTEFAVTKNALPLSFQNYGEGEQRGESGVLAMGKAMLGFHPSARWVGQDDAQSLAAAYYGKQFSDAPLDTDEFEKRQDTTRMRAMYQSGKMSLQDIADQVNSGKLPAKFIDHLFTTAQQSTLQRQVTRINPEQALKVFSRATPGEREQLRPIMLKKLDSVGPDRLQAFADELNK
jgi:hypothetical protein